MFKLEDAGVKEYLEELKAKLEKFLSENIADDHQDADSERR